MPKSSIKIAIVGCGRIGNRHADHIARLSVLASVCDIKMDRAEKLGKTMGCASYSSLQEMLKQEPSIDVVAVCTPNGLHAEQTIAALEAGKHVVCEKPMAIRSADCQQMINAAEKHRKKLFVVKQNRFNPPVSALKKAIDEGRLGKILSVQLNCFWNRTDDYYRESDWKGKQALDGGTLFTQFSHFLDLLLWMIGDVTLVRGVTRNSLHQKTVEFEDSGVLVLEFSNGAIGTVHYTVNSYRKNMEGSITVFGEKGTVKVGGQYLNALDYQSIKDHEISGLPQSAPANDYGFYQGSMSNHDKVYENVLDVLEHDSPIATSGEEGLKTVELIERIYHEVSRGGSR